MSKEKYYITTAIAYASGKPHFGNTYEAIATDAIARYKRQRGYDVRFMTGTDEHGQKVQNLAEKAGVTPQAYVDNVHIPSYAFIENYVLPISHDEVVHLKKSFLDKMPGDYWQKFAGARAFAAWMMTLPGAKLWFMGCEIGQFAEWSEERQLDWYLLDYELHAKLQHYFAALNNLYLTTPALWDEFTDVPEKSFEWLEAYNAEQSIIAFRRVSRRGKDVTVILNFTPVAHVDHNINVPLPGRYREIFNSDDPQYGGSGILNTGIMEAFPVEGNFLHRVRVNVPPMGVTILERVDRKNEALCP